MILAFLSLILLPLQPRADYVEEKYVGDTYCLSQFSRLDQLKFHACRYLYSKSWGWIDLKHFTAAAELLAKNSKINRTKYMFYYAILAGESHEQNSNNKNELGSVYSYEDLVSNFLGASFQYLANNGWFKGLSFNQSLLSFFESFEISDEPQVDAPNFKSLDEPKKNKSYYPLFNTKKADANHPIQKKLNELRVDVTQKFNDNRDWRERTIIRLAPILN
ncbi:MAG: hypothetical protein KA715_10440 [Xanthomonadaceae bacterium]|nr:hypothetical protein [Xanthomonadaceae bacterium]